MVDGRDFISDCDWKRRCPGGLVGKVRRSFVFFFSTIDVFFSLRKLNDRGR